MEKDLGTKLEWFAAEHHNTEHPHVHVVIRGMRDDGQTLRMSREYVQQGIRSIAADLCTRQLGYRTQFDGVEAEHREVSEKRFTSIDRRLLKDSLESGTVSRNPAQAGLSELARSRTRHDVARLAVLRQMGLAEATGPNSWHLRPDFEQVLRAMQRTGDRQRTLAAHGALLSDERLTIEALDLRRFTSVEGRVLVHGQDEQTGRNYLMLEGTDAAVHHIPYTPEMEQARIRGDLRVNSFVQLRRLSEGNELTIELRDLGSAEKLLDRSQHFRETARRLFRNGVLPTEDGWGGWLGRYQTALCKASREIQEVQEKNMARAHDRRRDRSLGR